MSAEKTRLVAAMNTLARNFVNDDAYQKWLDIIADPESADDRKCAEVANDEEWFCDAVHTFLVIMKRYGGEGFSISGRIYR